MTPFCPFNRYLYVFHWSSASEWPDESVSSVAAVCVAAATAAHLALEMATMLAVYGTIYVEPYLRIFRCGRVASQTQIRIREGLTEGDVTPMVRIISIWIFCTVTTQPWIPKEIPGFRARLSSATRLRYPRRWLRQSTRA